MARDTHSPHLAPRRLDVGAYGGSAWKFFCFVTRTNCRLGVWRRQPGGSDAVQQARVVGVVGAIHDHILAQSSCTFSLGQSTGACE